MAGEPFWGKYRGVVSDVDDPEQLGRIRATVPALLGETETGWAMPCVPYAGDGVGFHMIPPVGAGVWIEFEAGAISHPIWTGCWWAAGQLPPGATPQTRLIRTASHTLLLDDTDGEERLELLQTDGPLLRLDGDGVRLAHGGGAALSIDASSISLDNNGPAVILQASSITLEHQGQKIELGSASVTINNGALEVG